MRIGLRLYCTCQILTGQQLALFGVSFTRNQLKRTNNYLTGSSRPKKYVLHNRGQNFVRCRQKDDRYRIDDSTGKVLNSYRGS